MDTSDYSDTFDRCDHLWETIHDEADNDLDPEDPDFEYNVQEREREKASKRSIYERKESDKNLANLSEQIMRFFDALPANQLRCFR